MGKRNESRTDYGCGMQEEAECQRPNAPLPQLVRQVRSPKPCRLACRLGVRGLNLGGFGRLSHTRDALTFPKDPASTASKFSNEKAVRRSNWAQDFAYITPQGEIPLARPAA